MDTKKFKLKAEEIVTLVPYMGGCLATDKITVEGLKVGYMYRTAPHNPSDSGWKFFSGTEDQDYVDNADNTTVYNVNTIANYDPAIIPFLLYPYGTELERVPGTDSFSLITD